MNAKNKAVEKTELVIDVLKYANDHNLDINEKDSVKKILEVFDPGHTSDKEVEEFMEILQHTDKFLTMRAARKSKKLKIPN